MDLFLLIRMAWISPTWHLGVFSKWNWKIRPHSEEIHRSVTVATKPIRSTKAERYVFLSERKLYTVCILNHHNHFNPPWISYSSQAYKGSATSYHVQNLQPNSDYRFRVCAIRQCQDAPELSGPYSPTVTLSPQRSDMAVAGSATGSGSKASTESNRARRSLTDEQCAFLLLMVFAVIAILIAFVIQYFVIKWGVCTTQLQG